jgi:PTS system cellobiose-specific IIC component
MDKIFESPFLKKLQLFSERLSQNIYFLAISRGMMGTMGLLMIGALFMILATPPVTADILAQGGVYAAIMTPWYNFSQAFGAVLMVPYTMTMSVLAIFVAFGIAFNLAESYKMHGLSNGFVAVSIFLMIAAPAQNLALADGSSITAMPTGSLGGAGVFGAILVAIVTVKINWLCQSKKLFIRLPDAVPPFLTNSFAAMVPLLIDIIIFHGLNTVLTNTVGTTLPMAITGILSVPLRYLVSVPGVLVLIIIAQVFWFFGIHGSMVVYTALLPVIMQVTLSNGQLVAEGGAAVFHPLFLYGYSALGGGAGNALGPEILGARCKSRQLRAVSRSALIPSLFGVGEPALYGLPLVYNPILAIPFILSPIICALLAWAGFASGILRPTFILMLTVMPIGLEAFFTSMSWTNLVFALLVIPISMAVYFPFILVYDRHLLRKEAEAAEGA